MSLKNTKPATKKDEAAKDAPVALAIPKKPTGVKAAKAIAAGEIKKAGAKVKPKDNTTARVKQQLASAIGNTAAIGNMTSDDVVINPPPWEETPEQAAVAKIDAPAVQPRKTESLAAHFQRAKANASGIGQTNQQHTSFSAFLAAKKPAQLSPQAQRFADSIKK